MVIAADHPPRTIRRFPLTGTFLTPNPYILLRATIGMRRQTKHAPTEDLRTPPSVRQFPPAPGSSRFQPSR